MTITNNSGTVESISELKGFWAVLFPGAVPPEDSQWALWILRHDEATVRRGISELAAKYKKLGSEMDSVYMRKYASAVMNRLSETHERTIQ